MGISITYAAYTACWAGSRAYSSGPAFSVCRADTRTKKNTYLIRSNSGGLLYLGMLWIFIE